MRGVVFLGLALALLVGLVLLITSGPPESSETTQRLFPVEPSAVLSMVLESEKGRYALEQSDGEWQIVDPRRLPGDSEVVSAIVRYLARLEVVSASDPVGSGVDVPQATVLLRTLTQTLSARVGVQNTFDGRVYVARPDGAVFLAPGELLFQLRRSELDLRDARVVPIDVDAVTGFTVRGPSGSLAAQRQASGFRVNGESTPLDPAAMDGLLGVVASTRATRLAPSDSNPPPDAIHWTFASVEKTVTVSLWQSEDPVRHWVLSSALGLAELAGPAFHRRLSVDPKTLIDRRVFPGRPDDVRRIEIGEVVIQRGPDGWELGGDRANPQKVTALIYNLLRLERGRAAPAPTEAPIALRVVLEDEETKELQVFRGDSAGRMDGETFRLDAPWLGTLSADPSDYLKR